MSSNWKPQGSSTISVYLVAEGAQRVIDFLKKTLQLSASRVLAVTQEATVEAACTGKRTPG